MRRRRVRARFVGPNPSLLAGVLLRHFAATQEDDHVLWRGAVNVLDALRVVESAAAIQIGHVRAVRKLLALCGSVERAPTLDVEAAGAADRKTVEFADGERTTREVPAAWVSRAADQEKSARNSAFIVRLSPRARPTRRYRCSAPLRELLYQLLRRELARSHRPISFVGVGT